MARIPDELIEQVRDAADLLEVVQESVTLKRSGSDWRGPCPFHGGTNRNFAVIPRKNLYYCFVCHASGDVFTWYRERFGMDYPGAVREVARRVGIVIPEQAERAGPDPREPLFQACDAARSWYAARLRDGKDAEPARRYLLERQFPLDAAAEHGLGWAPRGGDFIAAMRELGVSDDTLETAALVQRRDDGTLYPRFRDRLLFPINDLRGRVVGFGGRLLGAGEPKYLNSPETPIFHKGEQLYHLHVAKLAIRKAGFAILVEGYFDALRLSMAGIDHVVAPLGTAFTTAQAKLLRRYTSEVIICYDSDAAGLRATFRAADVMLAEGVRVRVATMPEGDDPDTVVQRGGAAALESLLADAIDVLDRKLQLLELKGWFGDMHRTREALDRLLPTLQAPSDQVTRELYVTRVAERLGIPRETVAGEAAAPARRPMAPAVPVPVARPRRSEPDREGAGAIGAEIERKFLRLLIQSPDWLARAKTEVEPGLFGVATFRAIYERLLEMPDGGSLDRVADGLDDRGREVLRKLVAEPELPGGSMADETYASSIDALMEFRVFPEIIAEKDPVERNRRIRALSPERQQKFQWHAKRAASQNPRSSSHSVKE